MRVLLAAGGSPKDWPKELKKTYDWYVGIDRGSWNLLQAGFPLDLAIGDFDSLTVEEKKAVKKKAAAFIQAPAEKDDTDTQLGLKKILECYPKAIITIIGATGGRLDHLLANLWLPLEPRFKPYASNLVMWDRQNHVTYYLPGKHVVTRISSMNYLAYCCLTPVAELSIKNSKYELEMTDVLKPTSYASNEFTSSTATFSFSTGMVAVIQSKD
ncbi:thiamine diphosphokinase [Enterococcus ratti]|uniref:thiamine diphosphokinase n=1 Tax=Enterococcus ratti TaxID=150033 RepID=UPI0035138C7A